MESCGNILLKAFAQKNSYSENFQVLGNAAHKFNDTHREKLCFIQFSTGMAAWLLLIFFICLHNQLSSIMHSFLLLIKGTDV